MRAFTDMKKDGALLSWDEAQRTVSFYLMDEHLKDFDTALTDSEKNKVFAWSFETAYDSENFCYNFDTVNYALLSYIAEHGFGALETLLTAEGQTLPYDVIIGLVNQYCDLANDYKILNPAEGSGKNE